MSTTVDILIRARDQASNELRGIARTWENFSGALWSTTENLKNAKRAVEAVYATLRESAQIDATTNTFTLLAESIDTTAESLSGALSDATQGMVSNFDLMKASNQFVAMGLANTEEEAGKLAQIGTQLGLAFRGDAAAGMEEFALLLANQSIPRLDTFGISAGRVRSRILDLQKATPGLSRETAFLQAVMEQAEVTMGKVGDQSVSTAGKLANIEATLGDMKAEAQLATAQGVEPFLDALIRIKGISSDGESLFEGYQKGLSNFSKDMARNMTVIALHREGLIDWRTLWKGIFMDTNELGAGPERIAEVAAFDEMIDQLIRMEEASKGAEQAEAARVRALIESRYWSGTVADATDAAAVAAEGSTEATVEMTDAYWDAWRAMHGLDQLSEEVTGAFEDMENAEANLADQHDATREAAREAARAARELADAEREAASELGSLFAGAVELNPEADPLARTLWEQAEAAGASMGALALLGIGLDLFTEEQAINAIKIAALNVKIEELGTAVANGDISIGDAIDRLGLFQDALDGIDEETALGSIGAVQGALNGVVGSHNIDIYVRQHGQVPPAPGGAYIPETGPGDSDGSTYTPPPPPPPPPVPPPPSAEDMAEDAGMYRAAGGPVTAGRTYVVGEMEPEYFVPSVNGAILNGAQMRGAASGRGPVNVNIGTIVVPGAMAGSIETMAAYIGDRIGRAMRG